MNKTILTGRLTKDIELKYTQAGKAVTNFNLAVTDAYNKEKTDFIPIVVYGPSAEYLSKWLVKGKRVGVEGRISTRSFEGKTGKVYVTEIIADRVEIIDYVDTRADDSDEGEGFRDMEPVDDGDIPF